ncbi:MAG TPA: hypothetical protein VD767_08115 [Thermomicrobiales bacterium]|nr:hypothetical protein [Thermomicrobiales bacterium]
MLLAIAFLLFALLIAAWLITPDSGDKQAVSATQPESAMPETGTAPARA